MSGGETQAQSEDFTVVESIDRFQGRVIGLRTDKIRMPDGTESDRDIVVHPGAVAIVALDDSDRVVMVRQYRHPVGRLLDELPAGLLDVEGESALTGAKRELYEEASLEADVWNVLLDLHTSPGMTDEAIRIFLARGLRDVSLEDRFEPEHEEVTMTVHRLPLGEAVSAALAGKITNAAAVAGILAAATARDGGWRALRPADVSWPARPGR
ncbi:MAG: hydrolase [Pseudonocardiales bacterium]|nr:hydrolase [Pseudonocardiales bacterium]